MRYIISAILVLLFTTTAYSQEEGHKAGDISLNFSFNELAIDNYKNGIGGKYLYTDTIAFTTSINFGSQKNNSENNTTSSNSNILDYGFSLSVEKYLSNNSKLLPYIGTEIKYSNVNRDYSNNQISYDLDSDSQSYAINVLFGAEYQINQNISLAAEYSYGYTYITQKSSGESANQDSTIKVIGLGSSKLILLLYF